ncbi:hypothetical protein [uncultured Draconibacterium sp.]|uniref:hypothetical protein n=1 Tax=uncultured Draconibacterium sp. TaxID=1573823 RepID=UPI0032163F35
MRATFIFSSVLLIFLLSCKKEDDNFIKFTMGKEAEFQFNQDYTSSDGSLRFTLSEINDSRCPTGAMCVWAGEVAVTIEITKPVADTIILTLPDDVSATSGKYNFKLLEVSPYPDIVTQIKMGDYLVGLVISVEN